MTDTIIVPFLMLPYQIYYSCSLILLHFIFIFHVQDNKNDKNENLDNDMNTPIQFMRPPPSTSSLPSSSPSSPSSSSSSSYHSSSSPLPSSPLPSSPFSPTLTLPPLLLPLPQLPLSLPFSSLYSFTSDSILPNFHHHNYREKAFHKIPLNYSYSLANSTTYNTDLINNYNKYGENNDNNNNRKKNENENNNTKMKKLSKNKKTFFHTNNGKNKISELGKQIFSIYFTDLNLDFFRKHGGGGNGIELLIKNLSIAGSDSKNREKSGMKIRISLLLISDVYLILFTKFFLYYCMLIFHSFLFRLELNYSTLLPFFNSTHLLLHFWFFLDIFFFCFSFFIIF